jgi:GNAT superfamily N-acetyltransferase
VELERRTPEIAPVIHPAGVGDAAEILALQKLCFQSEARLYNDDHIPPLTQTLTDLTHEFETFQIFKLVLGDKIIGSVRGKIVGETCQIGRLMVHPEHQKRSLGSQLIAQIELNFPHAKRFELFTGSRSVGNLRLYEHLGYREIRRAAVTSQLDLIYLQKAASLPRPN